MIYNWIFFLKFVLPRTLASGVIAGNKKKLRIFIFFHYKFNNQSIWINLYMTITTQNNTINFRKLRSVITIQKINEVFNCYIKIKSV